MSYLTETFCSFWGVFVKFQFNAWARNFWCIKLSSPNFLHSYPQLEIIMQFPIFLCQIKRHHFFSTLSTDIILLWWLCIMLALILLNTGPRTWCHNFLLQPFGSSLIMRNTVWKHMQEKGHPHQGSSHGHNNTLQLITASSDKPFCSCVD